MKQLYLLFLLVAFTVTNAAGEVYRGYIVTKNRKQLTGYIGSITYIGQQTEVLFINDFGTPYNFRPELIKGFVFERNKEIFVYESLPTKNGRMFLQVLAKGNNISLYQSPKEKTAVFIARTGLQSQTYKTTEYWIQRRDRSVFRFKKWRYKKRLRALFRERAPDLAEKIGKKGYRFKDLPKIIQEYNEILEQNRYNL
jgi:hypothetical protein